MDITIYENVNGSVIYRTISEKSWEMMSPRTRERFNIAPKNEPKKIAIPQETIQMMEAAKETKPQANDNSEQENLEKVSDSGEGLVKTKGVRKRRTV